MGVMMRSLVPVNNVDDILPRYRGTPVELLLRYQNLGEPLPPSAGQAVMLIGMCMDHRKDLRLPQEFAYVLRSAGGNLRCSEFQVSYAVGVARVSAIALLAHTDCGMVAVTRKRDAFVRGLVEWGGCSEETASRQFLEYAPRYEIGDPLQFVISEAVRIQGYYPKLTVAPLLYSVEDDRLTQITSRPTFTAAV